MGSLSSSTRKDLAQRKQRSADQESALSKRVGGQVSKGSGSGWRQPNDVRSPGLLWEMKRTDKASISVKLEDFEKLENTALTEGRTPVLHLEIGSRRFVVLAEHDYLSVHDVLAESAQ